MSDYTATTHYNAAKGRVEKSWLKDATKDRIETIVALDRERQTCTAAHDYEGMLRLSQKYLALKAMTMALEIAREAEELK